MNNKALIIIDVQNDYFPGGAFPLWNTSSTLTNIKAAVNTAKEKQIPVILVQHIADPKLGISPFFNEGSKGAELHKELTELIDDPIIVTKAFADSFEGTNLDHLLQELNIDETLVCGMMTQNCVTHTAISKTMEKYNTSILIDCCTTVDEMIHNIALHAVSTHVNLGQTTNLI